MSEENVEVVRRMYDAFHSGDAGAALAYCDPEVVADGSKAGRPDIGTGRGREELRRIVTSWVGTWDEWREEIEEIRDLGSRVLVLTVQDGRGRGSGFEVKAHYAFLYDVHGGKLPRAAMYDDQAQALKAAGLRE